MKTSFLAFVIAGLLVTSLQSNANSDPWIAPAVKNKLDYKTFPATFCQLGKGKLGSLGYQGTAVTNIGTSTIGVECPIVRDKHDNRDGFVFQAAHKIANGVTMKCTVHSHDRYSGEVDFTNFVVVGDGHDHETQVTVKTSIFDGVYGLTCYLPRNSKISSYELIEDGATDNGF